MIEELIAARRASSWSRATLAACCDAPVQTIKGLEAGVGSVATLVAVMEALDFQLVGIGPGTTLHDQLRDRRRRLGLSLDQLAARTSPSRATIASLERSGGSVRSLLRLLAAIAPRARRPAPERAYWGQGDKIDRDSRFTPLEFLLPLYGAFGEIDLDPCAHPMSPVVARRRIMLSEGGDGLTDSWSGRLAFMNPPFCELLTWLRRAHAQWQAGNVKTVVCLVPVRTDSKSFHDVLSAVADIYLLQGRVRFLDTTGKAQSTPFSMMLVTLDASADQRGRCSDRIPGYWMTRETPAGRQGPDVAA